MSILFVRGFHPSTRFKKGNTLVGWHRFAMIGMNSFRATPWFLDVFGCFWGNRDLNVHVKITAP